MAVSRKEEKDTAKKKQQPGPKKVLWKIFWSTLYLSAFTFGGGYVIVTLMKDKFVDQYHWIEEEEMLDLIAIAQSSPGAVAVNGAIVVGYKLQGITGSLVVILGTILPPFVIISVLSAAYQSLKDQFIISQLLLGMQSGVGAVIASVVWDMGSDILKEKKVDSILIMLAAFFASCVLGINVIWIVLVCIGIGILKTAVQSVRKKREECRK